MATIDTTDDAELPEAVLDGIRALVAAARLPPAGDFEGTIGTVVTGARASAALRRAIADAIRDARAAGRVEALASLDDAALRLVEDMVGHNRRDGTYIGDLVFAEWCEGDDSVGIPEGWSWGINGDHDGAASLTDAILAAASADLPFDEGNGTPDFPPEPMP